MTCSHYRPRCSSSLRSYYFRQTCWRMHRTYGSHHARFGACATGFNEAPRRLRAIAFPAFRAYSTLSSSAWGVLLGGLHAGGCGKWLPCQPLRAVRLATARSPASPVGAQALWCVAVRDSDRHALLIWRPQLSYLRHARHNLSGQHRVEQLERGVALWDLLQAEAAARALLSHGDALGQRPAFFPSANGNIRWRGRWRRGRWRGPC